MVKTENSEIQQLQEEIPEEITSPGLVIRMFGPKDAPPREYCGGGW